MLELAASLSMKLALSPWTPRHKAVTLKALAIEPAVREQTPIDLAAAAKLLASRPRKPRRPKLGRALLAASAAGEDGIPLSSKRERQTLRT
jgi:hypothetical protein